MPGTLPACLSTSSSVSRSSRSRTSAAMSSTEPPPSMNATHAPTATPSPQSAPASRQRSFACCAVTRPLRNRMPPRTFLRLNHALEAAPALVVGPPAEGEPCEASDGRVHPHVVVAVPDHAPCGCIGHLLLPGTHEVELAEPPEDVGDRWNAAVPCSPAHEPEILGQPSEHARGQRGQLRRGSAHPPTSGTRRTNATSVAGVSVTPSSRLTTCCPSTSTKKPLCANARSATADCSSQSSLRVTSRW